VLSGMAAGQEFNNQEGRIDIMTVLKGTRRNPHSVEVCAVGCEADKLDQTLKSLNAEGWNIRQIYQEAPPYYRVFAQRESLVSPERGPIEGLA
jgi:hypothetical protein